MVADTTIFGGTSSNSVKYQFLPSGLTEAGHDMFKANLLGGHFSDLVRTSLVGACLLKCRQRIPASEYNILFSFFAVFSWTEKIDGYTLIVSASSAAKIGTLLFLRRDYDGHTFKQIISHCVKLKFMLCADLRPTELRLFALTA